MEATNQRVMMNLADLPPEERRKIDEGMRKAQEREATAMRQKIAGHTSTQKTLEMRAPGRETKQHTMMVEPLPKPQKKDGLWSKFTSLFK